MNKLIITVFLFISCLSLFGCTDKQEDVTNSEFEKILEQIVVPNMSTAILDLSETEQLKWLSDLYKFEVDTMQSKTSDLSESDLLAVKTHLSQVYGVEQVELLIDGFYLYNEEEKSFYVPDGSWFTYNDQWSDSHLSVTDRSEEAVVIKLIGKDNYGANERDIDHYFKIDNNRLLLERRTFIK